MLKNKSGFVGSFSVAFIYNDLNQPKKFEALMKEATEKDPTNPDLFFNIGIVNYLVLLYVNLELTQLLHQIFSVLIK